MLIEMKNGDTYNGKLVSCNMFMNICLTDVICTSRDGDKFWKISECYIKGGSIKYLRVPDEVFYILPGGGQKHGETLLDTLQRECREEIGTPVEAGEIAYVREYIGRHHHLRKLHKDFHQLEVVFHCELPVAWSPGPAPTMTSTRSVSSGSRWRA